MLGLGVGEILVIAAIVLIVVGPERLPEMMRAAGKGYAQLRRAAEDLRRSFVMEADRMEAEERLKDLEKRRSDAAEARKQALESAGPGAVAQEQRIAPPPPPPPADGPAPDDEAALDNGEARPTNGEAPHEAPGEAPDEADDDLLPRASLMPPPPRPSAEDGGRE